MEEIIETYYEPVTMRTVRVWENKATGDRRKECVSDELFKSTTGGPWSFKGSPEKATSHDTIFYGHTAAEWVQIKKERDELKKFIEEKLDKTIKDMKDGKE